jgi:small subunit ribosomal protein S13
MPRIIGVDIPKEKKIKISLSYIYGIGRHTALNIIQQAGVDPEKRAKDLTDEEVSKITAIIQRGARAEGDLRREVSQNIKRMMEIGCYKGIRHRKGLPVRGQRTSTNARTRKGPKKTVGVKREKSMVKGAE